MNKLLAAVALLSFGTAYAQGSGTAAKPAPSGTAAKPAASGAAAKPGTAPSGAAGAPSGEMMMPQKPGPETEALKPFAHNVTSTGTIVAGAMGPNSPET